MTTKIDNAVAAKALVEAMILGDRAAAEKHDVSVKTVQRWRSRLGTDPALSAEVQRLREKQDDEWAADIPAALTAAIAFLKEASTEADRKNPDAIIAITGALETLSDIALTQKMVDERLKAAREARAAE